MAAGNIAKNHELKSQGDAKLMKSQVTNADSI